MSDAVDSPDPAQLPPTAGGAVRGPSVPAGEHWTITPLGVAWFVALVGWAALLSFYHIRGGAGLEPVDAWVAQSIPLVEEVK